MAISVQVKNYRGCESANIECAPIALVSARNAQGKTSICQAVAAALTGDVLQGIANKGSAGVLVRSGAESGSVIVSSDKGESRVGWPECSAASAGEPPNATHFAAGIKSIVDLDDKERARVLSEYLRSDPTAEDFAEAMRDINLGEERIVAGLWKSIQDQGWDAAYEQRKEKGASYKGEWRGVTGQNYGSRKAETWEPEGWTEDLVGTTDRELEATVADAKAARDRSIAGDAATSERRKILSESSGKLADYRSDLETAEAALAEAETALQAAKEHRDALPSTQSGGGMPCPHCNGPLVIVRSNLVETRIEKAPDKIPDVELKNRRTDKAAADGTVSNLETKHGEAKRRREAAQVSVEIAERAKVELDTMPEPAEGSIGIDEAEQALAAAEKRLAAFNLKTKADEIHGRVTNNEAAMGVMAPGGLRAKKLARVLDAFNSTQLAPLSEAAKWKPVEIDNDLTIYYGGRRYSLLAESEKFRVRAVLQVAMAKLDGSEMVVIDGADILDGPTRSGLFGLLVSVEIPALVALTLTKPEQVPDLAAAEIGRSFWIESGVAKPIHQEVAA